MPAATPPARTRLSLSRRRPHTPLKSYWRSAVCTFGATPAPRPTALRLARTLAAAALSLIPTARRPALAWVDRKSVVQGKRVDLGGRRIIQKKKRASPPRLKPCQHNLPTHQ